MYWARQGAEYSTLEKLAELMALIVNRTGDGKKTMTGWQVWHRPGAKRPHSNALTVDFLHGLKEAFTKRRT